MMQMRKKLLVSLFVVILQVLNISPILNAFSSKQVIAHRHRIKNANSKVEGALFVSSREQQEFYDGLPSYLQPPMDSQGEFRLFLTQCSIQSFMFLLRQTKDPFTIRWLEDFTRPNIQFSQKMANYQTGNNKESSSSSDAATTTDQQQKASRIKLLQYHGLGAMNTTLFPTWESYFGEMLKQPKEFYLIESSRPHIPSYELDVDPASICSRILSVREQISQEFVNDLGVIANMGEHALESYWNNLRRLRTDDENNKNQQRVGIERENLLFLEWSPDRDSDYMPSPLRKGNFDLLTLLTTKESILRVLTNEQRRNGAEGVANEFLRSFFAERAKYFTGSQRYGRADTILEDLILSPPRMVQVKDDVTSLVDPMRMAELVIAEREKVALEWQKIARDSPKEHMEVRRMQLNRMMGIDN